MNTKMKFKLTLFRAGVVINAVLFIPFILP